MSNQTALPDHNSKSAADAWYEGRAIRLRGAAGGAELAGRLLAAPGVRSVVLDHNRDEATVHLGEAQQVQANKEEVLQEIASLATDQQAALATTSRRLQAASEIVCWLDRAQGIDSYFRMPEQATGWRRFGYRLLGEVGAVLAKPARCVSKRFAQRLMRLACYGLMRSSRARHEQVIRSPRFGAMLADWQPR